MRLFLGTVLFHDGLFEVPYRFFPLCLKEVPEAVIVIHLQPFGIEEVE